MRILVTGGAGFIGSNFVRKALTLHKDKFESVTVLDSLTYAGDVRNLNGHEDSLVIGDITNVNLVDSLICKSDVVVNFAAESHVDRSILDSKEFIRTNVVGVQVILDSALKHSKRLIHISTDEVYGSIQEGSWKEDSLIKPNSPYSASKAAGEMLVHAYHKTHGLDAVTTRCSNNYGTHHYPEKLIPLFITNVLEGKKVPIYGSGQNVRDWLHVDDHCDAIVRIIFNGRSGEVYNIGGGRELSNIELTMIILQKMGADESSIEYVEDRKGHDFRYSVDWSKINSELGYEPKVKFEDGLEQTIDWYKNNEAWWKPLKSK